MIAVKQNKAAKEAQRKVDELMRIIRWFDDYRAFKVADPAHIERALLATCPKDLVSYWKRVRKDINAMNDAIGRSPLRRLIAASAILRSVATTVLIGFVALFIGVAFLKVPLSLSYPATVALVLSCLVIVPNFYLYLDRYLRLRIREYHENLGPVVSSRMEKVKNFAQQMIFYMNGIIREFKLNPRKNRFRLRNHDYEGLALIKKRWFSGMYTLEPVIDSTENRT